MWSEQAASNVRLVLILHPQGSKRVDVSQYAEQFFLGLHEEIRWHEPWILDKRPLADGVVLAVCGVVGKLRHALLYLSVQFDFHVRFPKAPGAVHIKGGSGQTHFAALVTCHIDNFIISVNVCQEHAVTVRPHGCAAVPFALIDQISVDAVHELFERKPVEFLVLFRYGSLDNGSRPVVVDNSCR